jgi:NTP pyrophosphatase (non-canonical NTP hydrolase)
MKKIQSLVDDWFQKKGYDYWETLAIMARLTEETGEVAREVNILNGTKKVKVNEKRGDLEEELGDLLFTIGVMANKMNLDLEKGFQKALSK